MSVLDVMSIDASDIYKVDKLTAMTGILEIWQQSEVEIVHICWCATSLLGGIDEFDNELDV